MATTGIEVLCGTLLRAFKSTAPAACKEPLRAHLNAVHLEINRRTVIAHATDGHLLAEYEETPDKTHSIHNRKIRRYLCDLTSVLLCIKTIEESIKTREVDTARLSIHEDKESIILRRAGVVFAVIKLANPDGDPVPYKRVIPSTGLKPSFKHMSFDHRLITQAGRCFSGVTGGSRGRYICWEFQGELDPVTLSRRYDEYGSQLTVIVMPVRQGDEMRRRAYEAPKKKPAPKKAGGRKAKKAAKKTDGRRKR